MRNFLKKTGLMLAIACLTAANTVSYAIPETSYYSASEPYEGWKINGDGTTLSLENDPISDYGMKITKGVVAEEGKVYLELNDQSKPDGIFILEYDFMLPQAAPCYIGALFGYENGEHIIGVDNKKYKTAKECYNEEKIKPGAWGVLYLDFFGNAAAFDVKSNDNVYGYLIGISEENKLSPDVKFKIFTQNGEEEILESAKKIIYNEEKAYTGKEIYEKIKLLGGGSVLPQLVRYDYTEGGKLTKISVAQNVSDENKFRTGGTLSSAQCTNNSNVISFASKYIMSLQPLLSVCLKL